MVIKVNFTIQVAVLSPAVHTAIVIPWVRPKLPMALPSPAQSVMAKKNPVAVQGLVQHCVSP